VHVDFPTTTRLLLICALAIGGFAAFVALAVLRPVQRGRLRVAMSGAAKRGQSFGDKSRFCGF
jgi:hypothetical protein